MKPAPDKHPIGDDQAFDLLERPEDWPDDPAIQAELAELLELHLALRGTAGGRSLAAEAFEGAPRPVPFIRRFPWLISAAALLLVAVPIGYHHQHSRYLAAVAKDQARIQGLAQRRAQDRLWSAFFQQSTQLLAEFRQHPQVCESNRNAEDHGAAREIALALLQASHGLAAQEAPAPEAEQVRADLHAWLRELSLEDGCLEPQRAEELRQWASSHNLEDEATRLSHLLKGNRS